LTWVETESLSFVARHDDEDTVCAQRLLDELEDARLRLEERFDEAPGGITVVIHDNPASLAFSQPLLPIAKWAASSAARRYMAGWAMARELHLLNDTWMARRAGGDDSLKALNGTAERLYSQLVIAANNDRLPPPWGPRRTVDYLRWAWLVDGGAQYFANQAPLFRPAAITRLRGGERPSFPPGPRDALVLGGTVFELLDRLNGRDACLQMVSRLRKDGPLGNIEVAFEASAAEVEAAWRELLAEMAEPEREVGDLGPEPEIGSGSHSA
jgi:hypothetical protein